MAWDIRQDLQTGDWVFDSIRDLQGAEAEYLIQQRVHVRLMIERGTFIYDRTGTLGSRLVAIIGMGIPQSREAIEALVREALAPMTDITIHSVDVFTAGDGTGMVTDSHVIQARINYSVVFSLDQDIVSEIPGQFSTQVTIPT